MESKYGLPNRKQASPGSSRVQMFGKVHTPPALNSSNSPVKGVSKYEDFLKNFQHLKQVIGKPNGRATPVSNGINEKNSSKPKGFIGSMESSHSYSDLMKGVTRKGGNGSTKRHNTKSFYSSFPTERIRERQQQSPVSPHGNLEIHNEKVDMETILKSKDEEIKRLIRIVNQLNEEIKAMEMLKVLDYPWIQNEFSKSFLEILQEKVELINSKKMLQVEYESIKTKINHLQQAKNSFECLSIDNEKLSTRNEDSPLTLYQKLGINVNNQIQIEESMVRHSDKFMDLMKDDQSAEPILNSLEQIQKMKRKKAIIPVPIFSEHEHPVFDISKKDSQEQIQMSPSFGKREYTE